jgi:hypothetical protein
MKNRISINKKNFWYILPVFVLASILIVNSCTKKTYEVPWIDYSGYKAGIIFNDGFEEGLKNWYVEGDGKIDITETGQLCITNTSDSNGVMIWSRDDFSGNFLLEYEIEFLNAPGINILFLCAEELNGEDILKDLPPRSGYIDEYTIGQIRNYQLAYHCYDRDGNHYDRSRIRKNPGKMLLSHVGYDPCREDRKYYIDVVKISNRIQFYVDGNQKLVHDVRDKGGFGPVYINGKIGFWIEGEKDIFSVLIDNIRIFKLIPQ